MRNRWSILFFAAATGYISLSQEMLWFRAIGYATGGRPVVFAHTLGFFLLGVAAGAYWGEKRCAREGEAKSIGSAASFISMMLFLSALFCYLVLPMTAWIFTVSKIAGFVSLYLMVGVLSCFLGAVFPVLCHYGIKEGESVGIGISHIYAANIVGSTLGPLLTGFVLMEYLTTDKLLQAVSIATLALGVGASLLDWRQTRRFTLPIVAGALLIMIVGHPFIYASLLERLERKTTMIRRDGTPAKYRYVYENRHGIIAVLQEQGIDFMFGGGAFEGTFNINPADESNWIWRAYMICALHPNPANILNIGVAGGPWTRVLLDYPKTQKLVGIEIDPAYLKMMTNYPHIGSLLTDPRFIIHIDDGRRWLKRNPDEKFDFILQNTMLHWRSNSTNLLSEEYFRLIKSHLKPDGVFYLNATHSENIGYTLAHVFKHVVKVMTFYAGSDAPFTATPEQIRERLLLYRHDGKPAFDLSDPASAAMLDRLVHNDMSDLAPRLIERKDLSLITDDNMVPEFKDDRAYEPDRTWAEFFRKRASGTAWPAPE